MAGVAIGIVRFTKQDRKDIYDNTYFMSSRIEGNIARMVSLRTLDSWIIELKSDYCILYHDHPGQKKYHEHRRFQTVSDALLEIKAHDSFSISRST